MNATGTALQGKHTVEASELYMAFELGEKSLLRWLGDGRHGAVRERSTLSLLANPFCGHRKFQHLVSSRDLS